jgi:hypothetical protein
MPGAGLHIALVHYPVLDKEGRTVASSVVNYDIHDLARAARTFGVESYTVITPMRSQLLFTERLLEHWTEGPGAEYNPGRKEALLRVRLQPSIQATLQDLQERSGGRRPFVVATSARRLGTACSYPALRSRLETGDWPCLLLFGTGWGMTSEALGLCDAVLAPVLGTGDYNHLSVRAAAAIVLDRLCGRRPEDEIEIAAADSDGEQKAEA